MTIVLFINCPINGPLTGLRDVCSARLAKNTQASTIAVRLHPVLTEKETRPWIFQSNGFATVVDVRFDLRTTKTRQSAPPNKAAFPPP
jgi:hypothetical protein